jgi:hypothetical protein
MATKSKNKAISLFRGFTNLLVIVFLTFVSVSCFEFQLLDRKDENSALYAIHTSKKTGRFNRKLFHPTLHS